MALVITPDPSKLCLGVIGSSKFCIHAVESGHFGCGMAAHNTKKFTPPPKSAFIKDSDARAFCTPSYSVENLSPAQLLRPQGVNLTDFQWEELFMQLYQNDFPKGLAFEERPTIDESVVVSSVDPPILSPVAQFNSGGILASIPQLSFDDSVDLMDNHQRDIPLDDEHLRQQLNRFRQQFSSLKHKWLRAFTEVETGYGLLVNDLQLLQCSVH